MEIRGRNEAWGEEAMKEFEWYPEGGKEVLQVYRSGNRGLTEAIILREAENGQDGSYLGMNGVSYGGTRVHVIR